MWRLKGGWVLGGVVLTLNVAAAVPGSCPLRTPPDAVTQAGNQAMVAEDYATALDCYERAFASTQDPRHLYNAARALEFLDRPIEAYIQLRRFSQSAPAELKQRVPGLDELLSEYASRVGQLQLRGAPDGARVSIDGVERGMTPFALPLVVAPGQARVWVQAEGLVPVETHVAVAAGQMLTIELQWVASMPRPLVTGPSKPSGTKPLSLLRAKAPAAVEAEAADPWRTAMWSAVGVGGTALIVAASSFAVASSKFSQVCQGAKGRYEPPCESVAELDVDRRDEYEFWGRMYGGAWVTAGVAAAATGICYWQWQSAPAARKPGEGRVAFRVAPMALHLRGTF